MADIVQFSVAHAQNILLDMASSGHVTSGDESDVISGEKAIIQWILRNFRFLMRRSYFWRWSLPVTSLPVT